MAQDGEERNVLSVTMDENAIIFQLQHTQRVVYVNLTGLNCHIVPPKAPYYAFKKRKCLRWVDTGTAQSNDSYQLWLLITVLTMCKLATQRTVMTRCSSL